MLSLNLAPTLESWDYLNTGRRTWEPGIMTLALDHDLEYNNPPPLYRLILP